METLENVIDYINSEFGATEFVECVRADDDERLEFIWNVFLNSGFCSNYEIPTERRAYDGYICDVYSALNSDDGLRVAQWFLDAKAREGTFTLAGLDILGFFVGRETLKAKRFTFVCIDKKCDELVIKQIWVPNKATETIR